MSRKIILKKATRIEGNAQIAIEVKNGKVARAHFQVHEFRGFERFLQGRRVEVVPQLVSRICGLCSVSHQVASLQAIEKALGVEPPPPVRILREVMVLGEWIASHSLSYFFLTLPDFMGAGGGVFELMRTRPEIVSEAHALRNAGRRIVELLGKRAAHPVSLGVGCFLLPPAAGEVDEVRALALAVKDRSRGLIAEIGQKHFERGGIPFPGDQQLNLLAYDGRDGREVFEVFDGDGGSVAEFGREEFPEKVSELRADWTLAKFPYLTTFGFPRGILLVGPLARFFQEGGVLEDPELSDLEMTARLRNRSSLSLEDFDACRLLEIFWSAKRILELLDRYRAVPRLESPNSSDTLAHGGPSATITEASLEGSGHGLGILEAPRGTLVHDYLVNRGRIERVRLLVATQFNNAFINLVIKDQAQRHIDGDAITEEGEKLLGRCIRLFDPCMSCATH